MRILVTGANGLIGRRLLTKLGAGYERHAVVRKMPDVPVEGVIYHQIDFGGAWAVSSLPETVDVIYHMAQSENFRNFPDGAMDVFKVNVDSTASLLDYAQKCGAARFVYASSGGVYGAGAHAFHENSPISEPGKLGYYLGSKLCSEILVESYVSCMQVNIARFFFVYGPEQKRSMLIPRLVDSVREGRAVQLQGENGISINPIHVSDAVCALQKMLDVGQSTTFNIAGRGIYSIKDIAEIIGSLIGRSPVYQYSPGSAGDIVANIGMMEKELFSPKVCLEDGIKEFL